MATKPRKYTKAQIDKMNAEAPGKIDKANKDANAEAQMRRISKDMRARQREEARRKMT